MGAGTGSCLPPALTLPVTAPGTTNNKRRINKKNANKGNERKEGGKGWEYGRKQLCWDSMQIFSSQVEGFCPTALDSFLPSYFPPCFSFSLKM